VPWRKRWPVEPVTSANSFIGASANDQIGETFTSLTNGNYVLAMRTTAGDQQRITQSTAKVRDWLPGKHVAEIALDLPAGKNHLALALLDSRTQTPAIQFANEGRSDDRWHTLGECEI